MKKGNGTTGTNHREDKEGKLRSRRSYKEGEKF